MSIERCPACAAPQIRSWRAASASDPARSASPRYMLVRCAACHSAFTPLGQDEDLEALYRTGTYAPARAGLGAVLEPLRRLTEIDRLRYLRGIPAGSRVLEVGAGDGRFLALLARRGYQVAGIEPSASSPGGDDLPIQRTALEQAEVDAQSLDAIVVWHVLEHTADPAAALTRIRGWLRPGGRLVVAVPNLASVQALIGGDSWFHQDVPRHRAHFTPKGLRALLRRTGFEPTATSHLILEHNALGMWQTLLNRLTAERNVAFRYLKRDLAEVPRARRWRDLALSAFAGALLVVPAIATELAAGLARRGGTIVVVARAA